MAALSKKELVTICTAICVAVTTTVSAMVWVENRITTHTDRPHPGAISRGEFRQFVATREKYEQRMLDRLQSIEEAIRANGVK